LGEIILDQTLLNSGPNFELLELVSLRIEGITPNNFTYILLQKYEVNFIYNSSGSNNSYNKKTYINVFIIIKLGQI